MNGIHEAVGSIPSSSTRKNKRASSTVSPFLLLFAFPDLGKDVLYPLFLFLVPMGHDDDLVVPEPNATGIACRRCLSPFHTLSFKRKSPQCYQ
jgi:hypothetical protein